MTTPHQEEPLSRTRVLIVDDQQLVRDGIASLLRMQEGIDVVGTATNGQEAVEQAMRLQPEVILMDVRMPMMDGVEATVQILKQVPSSCILMLTTFDDDEYVRKALRAGARGYLLKDLPAQDLANAVRAVSQGVYQLDASVIERMIETYDGSKSVKLGDAEERSMPPLPNTKRHTAADSPDAAGLTNREREILRLIARGATNREVADALVISEGTVKNHLSNIFSRLGLRDRTQAVMYARERGLL
ncbi:MAG TPA: response regulator transcription factor [Ktedonobacteraceae bacterium]|nr:response regulator transcription factor [Ktedonobacteraceae bacterium]